MSGICYLVGAGTGDLSLITLRAKELLAHADVVVYDYLANPDLLAWLRKDAERVYVGKTAGRHTLTQSQINSLLVNHVRKGEKVVRLKGGDPFIFGRGGEEAEALHAAGCKFEVVPGITAALAAAAYAGIPLSHRQYASTVTFLTGHEDSAKAKNTIDWGSLTKLNGTIVIYMGMERLSALMLELEKNEVPLDCPVAVIQWAATGRQKTVIGEVENIVSLVKRHKAASPAVIIIGNVVKLREKLRWFEKKPLHGKRIVLTRTRAQSSRLRALLEEDGADVFELPTIKIEHCDPKIKIKYSDFQWLIFASPNGVEHFFEWHLHRGDIRDLAGLKIAAIGLATAEAIEARGLRVDLLPEEFTSQGLVEAWLKSEDSAALYPCSNRVRDEIADGLKEKGVTVTYLEVYKTLPELDDFTGAKQRLIENGADWIIFTSSSAVENFHALKIKVSKCRFASLGPVTSATMKKLGYTVDLEAEKSKIERLVEGILRLS